MKVKRKCTKLKNLQGWQGAWLWTSYTSRLVVHEARLACPAMSGMSLVYHHITVVEKLCKRGHYSPLRWTGLAAEGQLNWLSG